VARRERRFARGPLQGEWLNHAVARTVFRFGQAGHIADGGLVRALLAASSLKREI
jgi:hypothetical protein